VRGASFGDLDTCVQRGSRVVSVPDLKQAIEAFMQAWNQNPRPFIWTATVEGIIKKIERARVKMEQIKPGSTLPRGRKKAAGRIPRRQPGAPLESAKTGATY
jgi:hypothetical protein